LDGDENLSHVKKMVYKEFFQTNIKSI